jgi:polyhydroxybutyrate depolymerase
MERYSGLSHQADLHGFVVAYPDSVGPKWNIGEVRTHADDVAYIDALITDLQSSYCLDAQRTFATGISNGAGMAALLGCELSARLTAVAPVAGIYDNWTSCRGAQPVSLLEIHGTADRIAPYFGTGGTASSSNDPPSFVRGWVHRETCLRTANIQHIATRTQLYRWSGCAGGTDVEHIRINEGGHDWPGSLPPGPGPPATICAACMIWSFFSQVPSDGASNDGGVGLSG